MATKAAEAPDSPETEDSGAAENVDAFAQLAEQFVSDGTGAETKPEGEAEAETTDLSHPKDEPTEPDPKADDEPGAEEDEDTEDDGIPPDLQDRINRRIGKEVAKRKAEQERVAALEAELAEVKGKLETAQPKEPDKPVSPPPTPPLPELQKIDEEIGKVEQIHNGAVEYLRRLRREGDEVLAELREVFPKQRLRDEDDARDMLEGIANNTVREWHKLATRRENEKFKLENRMEQEREQTFNSLKPVYPWVESVRSGKDTKSAEAQIANRIRKEAPYLEQAPKGWQVIARLVRAELAERGEPTKPATPTPKPPKLPTSPKVAAPSTGQKGRTAEIAALEKKFAASGRPEDAADLISVKLLS